MVSLREAQKQMTRRLLLDAGLELFGTKGYAATTVDDIAAAVGTTRTTFYMHFPSKVHLMQALIPNVDHLLTSEDDLPLTDVVAARDRVAMEAWLRHKVDKWPAIRPYILAAHDAAAQDPSIRSAVTQWFESVIDQIEKGLDSADRYEPSTRRLRGALAFGQLEFLSRRWFRFGWDVDPETTVTMLTESWSSLLLDG